MTFKKRKRDALRDLPEEFFTGMDHALSVSIASLDTIQAHVEHVREIAVAQLAMWRSEATRRGFRPKG